MRRRIMLLSLALLLVLASNLHPCCQVYINGEKLDGLYSPRNLAVGLCAARLAADEITPLSAELPRVSKRWRLSLSYPSGEIKTLTDSILRETTGVAAATAVSAAGEKLGYVKSGQILLERLHEALSAAPYNNAADARLEYPLVFNDVYTRTSWLIDYSGMLALIKSAVPVIYSAGQAGTEA